jgi:hypothetical protein
MYRILNMVTRKTIGAAVASLAMVGTAGAALGTSYSTLETSDTVVETTVADSTVPDTAAPETTVADTVADTVVDTTAAEAAPAGANGLCVAMQKAEDRGKPKKSELKSFGRVAGAASAAGVDAEGYCAEVLAAKQAADDDSMAGDESGDDDTDDTDDGDDADDADDVDADEPDDDTDD